MRLDDRTRDGEAQSRAGAEGAAAAPEPLEQLRQLTRSESRALVADLNDHVSRFRLRKIHGTAGGGVPDRVVHQVVERAADRVDIAGDHRGRSGANGDLDAARLRPCGGAQPRTFHDLLEVHLRRSRVSVAAAA